MRWEFCILQRAAEDTQPRGYKGADAAFPALQNMGPTV